MSTATTPPPAPEYTFTVNDEGVILHWQGQTFQIEATDLETEGWHRAPDCDPCELAHVSDLDLDAVMDTLRRWHDEQSGHPAALMYCDLPPCRDLREGLDAA